MIERETKKEFYTIQIRKTKMPDLNKITEAHRMNRSNFAIMCIRFYLQRYKKMIERTQQVLEEEKD